MATDSGVCRAHSLLTLYVRAREEGSRGGEVGCRWILPTPVSSELKSARLPLNRDNDGRWTRPSELLRDSGDTLKLLGPVLGFPRHKLSVVITGR